MRCVLVCTASCVVVGVQCPRGYKLVQPQQMKFEWSWLSLAVDVQAGRLFWRWQERLRSDCVRETVTAWKEQGMGALVWVPWCGIMPPRTIAPRQSGG